MYNYDYASLINNSDIAHRDVKCNNILIRNCPPCIGKEHNMLDIPDTEEQKSFATAWDVCLTDFGLSAENKRAPAMMSVCGTVITMAPGSIFNLVISYYFSAQYQVSN